MPSSPAAPQPDSLYVDISTPSTRTEDVFEFVDLDLDVEVIGGGRAARVHWPRRIDVPSSPSPTATHREHRHAGSG